MCFGWWMLALTAFLFYYRYSSSELPTKPTCQHKKGIYNCDKLSMRDLLHFHEAFYKYTDKETQDAFLLKFYTAKVPKRKRPRKNKYTPKKFQTKLSVYSVTQKAKVIVCQKAFLDIIHITKHRVQYVTKMFLIWWAICEGEKGRKSDLIYSHRKWIQLYSSSICFM